MDRPTFGYRFGTAEFDEARFELRVAGLPVEVEPRALEVLAYLLRHAGEVVTKDELLREVWAGRVTVDKVLPNAITKLRRALGEANAEQISTQARIGYRFDGAVTRTAVGRQTSSELKLLAGHAVPTRPNFVLRRQLARTEGSEVWLAEHAKTREVRVYKFALDGDRLRALKREATLMRLLQDSFPEQTHFIDIVDWNFEVAPYFLECEYGGSSLVEWAQSHLPALDRAARIALFLQIADAVAAAHSVGVLHKDLKPANVLVDGEAAAPRVRLTDFGSGHLLEPDRLEQFGITRLGMTVDERDGPGSTSFTPLYVAPELFAGLAPTVRSDVYALGVLLYQVLTGRIGQPMAPGWEADIDDALLRDDLRRATDGDPERRLSSAAELASRLRALPERRIDAVAQDAARDAARRDREALARSQARRPILLALIAVLAIGIVIALWLQQQAVGARNAARAELQRATALTRFLNEDLIGRSNPLVSAKGPETTLREVLVSARDRVPARFSALPATEANIRASLASAFGAIDASEEARAEAERALALFESSGDAINETAFATRVTLIRALSRLGRFDEAQAALAQSERLAGAAPAVSVLQQLATARAALFMARSDFEPAVVALREAIERIDPADIGASALRDVLRIDLIAALSQSGQDAMARDEGLRLIEEASNRAEDSSLLVALTRVSLARAQGEDHAAAEALLLQAQPVIVATLGEDHSRHLRLLNELFGVAFRRGDWPQAIDYARRVHERIRAKFGDENPVSWVTLLNLARTLNEAGDSQPALEPARLAHARLAALAGPKSPQAQDALVVLALIELEVGDLARAAELIAQLDADALESHSATGGWPFAIDALRGIERQRSGDAAAARPLLDGALHAMRDEAELDAPGRLYRVAKQARAALD
jgi:DNA-binding winged helix-turn-helix (wHTH) protein/tetratricopeptide (TPR) repeat protein